MPADELTALAIPPGLYKNGTLYEAKNRWYDANLIRFWQGTKQPIGGWRRALNADGSDNVGAVTGVPRAMASWRADTGDRYLAIGTHQKLQLLLNGILYDLTPAGFTPGLQDSGYTAGGGQYNNGAYGVGLYGVGSTSTLLTDADTWQLDNFGQWLVAVCTSDSKLYVWHNDVVTLPTIPAGAPTARAAVVTPERFLVALGANGDMRLVQWASQNTIDVWTPLDTNSAGQLPISGNGRLVCGRRARGQTLIWSDTDLWSLTFIGGILVYRLDQVGDSCGIIAPNACVVVDGRAYWMGTESFFGYDGFVKPIPSDVADYVFGDMNRSQKAKISCLSMADRGEIWWFYPSGGANENDRYVVYNFVEQHWTTGILSRTAGVGAGATESPMMCDSFGRIYEHEILMSREGTEETGVFLADGTYGADGSYLADGALGFVELVPFLASGPVELGDGTELMSVSRFVPDVLAFGDVDVTLFAASEPAEETNEIQYGPYTLSKTIPLRLAARQLRFLFTQVNPTGWRIGAQRVGMLPGGRR